MIVVTGSNGFIGSNLIKGLNNLGHTDIIAVDDHSNPELKENITHCAISDYLEIQEFFDQVKTKRFDNQNIEAIFHQGACSNTMEWDSEYLYKNNLLYSKELLKLANRIKIPFIYASSARGLPFACTGSNSESPLYEDVVKEEMKGLEDLIPPPPKPFSGQDGDSVQDAGRRSSRAPRRRSCG